MSRIILLLTIVLAGCSNQNKYDSRQETSLNKLQTIYMMHGLEVAICNKKKPFDQLFCYKNSFEQLSINWVELKGTSEFESSFLDEIVTLEEAGVLQEYIFKYYYKEGWGIPNSINWSAFDDVHRNLKEKHPLMYPYSEI